MKRYVRILVTVSSFAVIALGTNIQPAAAYGPFCKACVEECEPEPEEAREACQEFCNSPARSGTECWDDVWNFCSAHPGLEAVIECERD
jgi:hypothetical protein